MICGVLAPLGGFCGQDGPPCGSNPSSQGKNPGRRRRPCASRSEPGAEPPARADESASYRVKADQPCKDSQGPKEESEPRSGQTACLLEAFVLFCGVLRVFRAHLGLFDAMI